MDKYLLTSTNSEGKERIICWSNNFGYLTDIAYGIDNNCVENGYRIYELVERNYSMK